MATPLPPEFILRDLLKYFQEQSRVMRPTLKSMVGGQDFLDGKLKKMHIPVFLVYGNEDKLVPVEVGQKIHQEISGSKFMIIEKLYFI